MAPPRENELEVDPASFEHVKGPADVRAWMSTDKKTCIFSLDGEAEGTLLYTLENGLYRFKAYIVYTENESSKGDFSSFDGVFSRAKTLRPPLLLFDDPLPRYSARILEYFARRFLSHFHVHEIKRARDILLEPIGANEQAPQQGDQVLLSHSYVTRMEMHVTEDLHWKVTRFDSSHPTREFDRHGNMVPRVIEWNVKSPTLECQDACFGPCGVVLTERKLHQLLELQLGMITKPRNSELIVAGIAACYNGNASTYNPSSVYRKAMWRRLVTDRLRTMSAYIAGSCRCTAPRDADKPTSC